MTRKVRRVIIIGLSYSLAMLIVVGVALWQYRLNNDNVLVTQRFEAKVLPIINEYDIQHLFLNRADWCQAIQYHQQAYIHVVDTADQENCAIYAGKNSYNETTFQTQGFTPAVQKDYTDIVKKLNTIKPHLLSIERNDTTITLVSDIWFERRSYVYQPGYTLPADIPNELWHTRISDNWYRVDEDWN